MANHPNRSKRKTITVPNVSVPLLRRQRNALIEIAGDDTNSQPKRQVALDGVINLLDSMLDIAEGVEPVPQ